MSPVKMDSGKYETWKRRDSPNAAVAVSEQNGETLPRLENDDIEVAVTVEIIDRCRAICRVRLPLRTQRFVREAPCSLSPEDKGPVGWFPTCRFRPTPPRRR